MWILSLYVVHLKITHMNKGAALKYLHGTGKFIKVFALLTRDDGEERGEKKCTHKYLYW